MSHEPGEVKFPVSPVETGNFIAFSGVATIKAENGSPNQSLASEFPVRSYREFASPHRELNTLNRE
jgi:hypothetical protein